MSLRVRGPRKHTAFINVGARAVSGTFAPQEAVDRADRVRRGHTARATRNLLHGHAQVAVSKRAVETDQPRLSAGTAADGAEAAPLRGNEASIPLVCG
ncbi:hypothetical protein GCM10018785_45080 [Streptomyces longispororuber]|uniref:Uncharacterized protein n=1 Tax=Streptomyces longispororuber TaxID=68230 RepID=A0A918ZW67_9ACTN|nr:hypothetical protein GCM10018785_45080 [Streptomyces longispororuber]